MNPVVDEDGLALRMLPGKGDSVLWIHGYTLDSSIWTELWEDLPEYTHVGVDLPGHGASRRLNAGENLFDLAAALVRLANRHGVRHLVGLSFGGMIALQVAMVGDFDSLVLASPALGGGPQDLQAQSRNLELMRAYKERGPGPWLRYLWMQMPPDIFRGASNHPNLWRKLCEVIDRHSWSELADGRMQALTNFPQTSADLGRIRAATLILVGEEDMTAFKRSAELIRRSVSEAKRVYVPDSGHLCLLESPKKIYRLLADHWKKPFRHCGPQPETKQCRELITVNAETNAGVK